MQYNDKVTGWVSPRGIQSGRKRISVLQNFPDR